MSDEHGSRIASLIREQHRLVEQIEALGPDDAALRGELWKVVVDLQAQIAAQVSDAGFEP